MVKRFRFRWDSITKKIKKDKPEIPVIIISGHGNIEMAVDAIKNGAYEFIEKPFSSERLLLTVKRSIETFLVKNENTALKEKILKTMNLLVPLLILLKLNN